MSLLIEMEQKLIDAVAEQIKQGKNYYDIQKSLASTDFKFKDINKAIRLIRIVGVDNANEKLLSNIKENKLFIKKSSKLGLYFNIAILTLFFNLVLRIFGLIVGGPASSFALGIILFQMILLVTTIIGLYYATDWGITLYSAILILSLYGLFSSFTSIGITVLTLIDVAILAINAVCFLKIMKKFTWRSGV